MQLFRGEPAVSGLNSNKSWFVLLCRSSPASITPSSQTKSQTPLPLQPHPNPTRRSTLMRLTRRPHRTLAWTPRSPTRSRSAAPACCRCALGALLLLFFWGGGGGTGLDAGVDGPLFVVPGSSRASRFLPLFLPFLTNFKWHPPAYATYKDPPPPI